MRSVKCLAQWATSSIHFQDEGRHTSHPNLQFRKPWKTLFHVALFVLILAYILTPVYAKDYYEILGVSRDADSSTIKRAFRKLAVKYHPDKNPGDKEAEKLYSEINNAYEILSDEGKRSRYDRFGDAGLKNGGPSDDDDFDPFGDMFGFGGRRRQRQEHRVPDVIIPLSVSLETLYNGAVMDAVHKRRVICSNWSDCEKKCSRCGGSGVIIQTRRLGPGFVQQMQTPCDVCGGRGKIGNPKCTSCPQGQFEETEKPLLIDVEKGMSDGQFVTFEGETDEVPDHVNGDVKFKIVTQPHDRFTRSGDDLHYTLHISLSEALVGVNRQVRQLDGRLVPIKTDRVISPGEEFVIEEEGMPREHGDENGDMIVKFWVDFPTNLTDDQKESVVSLHGALPTLDETGDGTKRVQIEGEQKTEL